MALLLYLKYMVSNSMREVFPQERLLKVLSSNYSCESVEETCLRKLSKLEMALYICLFWAI